MDRIARNYTTAVTPVIEVINDDTFNFDISKASDVYVGGFSWDLIVRLCFDIFLGLTCKNFTAWIVLCVNPKGNNIKVNT